MNKWTKEQQCTHPASAWARRVHPEIPSVWGHRWVRITGNERNGLVKKEGKEKGKKKR